MVKLITTLNINERGFHMEEILYCLYYNLKHPLINDITIIFDIKNIPEKYEYKLLQSSCEIADEFKVKFHPSFLSLLDNNNNIFFMITKSRPTYKYIFDYTNKIKDIWILCNVDIYYPHENKSYLEQALSTNYDNTMICLTRYDKIIYKRGHYTHFHDGYTLTYKNNTYKTQQVNGCSIDTWIYKTPIKDMDCNYNIELGRIGCDGMMNYQLSKNYNVINPCFDVISIHNHKQHKIYNTINQIVSYYNVIYKYSDYIKMMQQKGFLLKNIGFSCIDKSNAVKNVNNRKIDHKKKVHKQKKMVHFLLK